MNHRASRAIIVKDDNLLVMHRNKFGQIYYTLIGGGVDPGETPEQSIIREVKEETSLDIDNPRLVYIENAGKVYGTQYIFSADYQGGEIKLEPDSGEAKLNKLKFNLYKPMWLPISKLAQVPFLSAELKQHLIKDLKTGFGDGVIEFSSSPRRELSRGKIS